MPEAIISGSGTQYPLILNSDGSVNSRIVDTDGDAVKIVRLRENLLGSAGTGSNPTKVFTLTTTSAVDIVEVYLDGLLLVETSQYTINNAAKTVTMVDTVVGDAMIVSVFYNV